MKCTAYFLAVGFLLTDLFGGTRAEAAPVFFHRNLGVVWSFEEWLEVGIKLELTREELTDQRQIMEFVADALDWRQQGNSLNTLRSPFIHAQARELLTILDNASAASGRFLNEANFRFLHRDLVEFLRHLRGPTYGELLYAQFSAASLFAGQVSDPKDSFATDFEENGRLILPFMRRLRPQFELSIGFLPVAFLRFPGVNSADVYLGDRKLVNRFRGIGGTTAGTLDVAIASINRSWENWKAMIVGRSQSAPSNVVVIPFERSGNFLTPVRDRRFLLAFALIHHIRYESLDSAIPPVDWGDAGRIVAALSKEVLGERVVRQLRATGVRRYGSFVPGLTSEKFEPEEMAGVLNLVISRLSENEGHSGTCEGSLF